MKVLKLDFNLDNVGKFLRSADSEFQTDGAMKLKERSLKDFRFCLGILSNFFFLRLERLRWFIGAEG